MRSSISSPWQIRRRSCETSGSDRSAQASARLSVEAALRSAAIQLSSFDTPRLDAEVLLGHVLNQPRAWLLAHLEYLLACRDRERFTAAVSRRVAGEPLAYIVGGKEWYGRRFAVTQAVLVPRPETELALEEALRLARALDCRSIVDVGTGSGAIAVTLGLELPASTIDATDISASALEVARHNAAVYGVEDRVHFYLGSLLEPIEAEPELIVANLPYLSQEEMRTLPAEVRHEPSIALRGGEDGLDLYRHLFRQVVDRELRCPLVLEIGAGQGQDTAALATSFLPLSSVTIKQDYAGLDRIAVIVPGGRW